MASIIELIEVRFATHYQTVTKDHVISVTGSCAFLGSWDPDHALLLTRQEHSDWWEGRVLLPLTEYFEWKLIVYDSATRQVVRWEEIENRWNWVDRGPIEITVWWNGDELTQCTIMECKYLHCHCLTPYTNLSIKHSDLVTLTFLTHFRYADQGHVLAICGSGPYLGDWNPILSRQFDKTVSTQHHSLSLTITMPVKEKARWKFVLLDKRYRHVVMWEDHDARVLETDFPDGQLTMRRLIIGVNWNEDIYKTSKSYKCMDESCKCGAYSPNNSISHHERNKLAPSKSEERTKLLSQVAGNGSTHRSVHFLEDPVSDVHLFQDDTYEDESLLYLDIPMGDSAFTDH